MLADDDGWHWTVHSVPVYVWKGSRRRQCDSGLDLRSQEKAGKVVPEWHHFTEFMPTTIEDKARITARVAAGLRDTLEQAAQLRGATLSQFVVQCAFEEAQRILERETVIRLSRRGAQKVFALLEHPPEPSQALKQAARSYRKRVRV